MKRGTFIVMLIFSLILLIQTSHSSLQVGYDGKFGVDLIPPSAINYSTEYVNSSKFCDFWDALDIPSDISGSEFWYNQTTASGDGSYNATYDIWAYNQTTAGGLGDIFVNESGDTMTGNLIMDGANITTPILKSPAGVLNDLTIMSDGAIAFYPSGITYPSMDALAFYIAENKMVLDSDLGFLFDNNVEINGNATADYFLGNTITPTNHDSLVNKDYVDNIASAIAFDFFFTNHTSDISGHYDLVETDVGHEESSVTSNSLSSGTNVIFNFTTESGAPEFNVLRSGVYDARLHLFKTGTKSVTITPKLYNISSDGLSKTLILTFETSIELTTIDATYDLHGVLTEEIVLPSDNRLHMEFVAEVGASGSNPTVTLDMEGTTDTHISIETSSNAFEKIFLRQDGTTPLTSNWNYGPFNLNGSGIITATHEGDLSSNEGEQYLRWDYGSHFSFSKTCINISNDASLDITADITIAFWMKSNGGSGIIYGGYGASGCGIYLLANSIWYWSSIKGAWVNIDKVVNDNIWHHVAVSVNGSVAFFYIDGIFNATRSTNYCGAYSGDRVIGSSYHCITNYTGYLDDFMLFNDTLTTAEVYSLYLQGKNIESSEYLHDNLVSHWRFEENVEDDKGVNDGADIRGNETYIDDNAIDIFVSPAYFRGSGDFVGFVTADDFIERTKYYDRDILGNPSKYRPMFEKAVKYKCEDIPKPFVTEHLECKKYKNETYLDKSELPEFVLARENDGAIAGISVGEYISYLQEYIFELEDDFCRQSPEDIKCIEKLGEQIQQTNTKVWDKIKGVFSK